MTVQKKTSSNFKFSKILVAIDGSDYSFRAAEYALDLAKKFHSRLNAITVTFIPESKEPQQDQMREFLLKEGSNNSKQPEAWYDNFKNDAINAKIELKTELLNSTRPVDYVIVEYAENNDIDLIVMGTRGRTGIKKLLLGSIASSVVKYSDCPVLIVK